MYITSNMISMKKTLVKLKFNKMGIFKMADIGVTMWRKYSISQKTFQVKTEAPKILLTLYLCSLLKKTTETI